MRDIVPLVEKACDALRKGDIGKCAECVDRLERSAGLESLAPDEIERLAAALSRLRGLAGAAGQGLDAARRIMRDISVSAGALDVYDRAGRQRVSTGLARPSPRY